MAMNAERGRARTTSAALHPYALRFTLTPIRGTTRYQPVASVPPSPSTDDEFVFVTAVDRLNHSFGFHYLRVPDEVADALIASGSRRVIATINGFEVKRALQSSREAGQIIVVGLSILKEAGVELGHPVEVVLWPDPEPDRIDLCEEFETVLEQDPEAAERFFDMTPGMQRSIAMYANSAKRVETRIKRALELAHKLRTRTLHGDRDAS